jgi:molybdopterin converting factor small subunit
MATVIIPTPLRKFTNNTSRIVIKDHEVGGILRQLTSGYPALKQYLFDPDGRVTAFINVFVNNHDIRNLDREKTVVEDSAVISIVPAIAGGSPSTD